MLDYCWDSDGNVGLLLGQCVAMWNYCCDSVAMLDYCWDSVVM